MDVRGGLAATGNVDVASARRAAADEDGVEILREQRLQAVDPVPGPEVDAEVEHVAHLLVDHGFRQAELGDLRAHHPAALRVAVEHDALVAERGQVAGDRERCRTGADERDPLAVLRRGARGETVADVVLEVGGDALQTADCDGFRLALAVAALLDPAAAARRLARPITGAAENAREDVGFPVDEVGVRVAAGRDQPDVLGDGGVGRARPLAIDDFVEIVGLRDIRRLQTLVLQWPRQVVVLAAARHGEARFAPDLFAGRMLRLARPREKA